MYVFLFSNSEIDSDEIVYAFGSGSSNSCSSSRCFQRVVERFLPQPWYKCLSNNQNHMRRARDDDSSRSPLLHQTQRCPARTVCVFKTRRMESWFFATINPNNRFLRIRPTTDVVYLIHTVQYGRFINLSAARRTRYARIKHGSSFLSRF